jgi:hypothetical protein
MVWNEQHLTFENDIESSSKNASCQKKNQIKQPTSTKTNTVCYTPNHAVPILPSANFTFQHHLFSDPNLINYNPSQTASNDATKRRHCAFPQNFTRSLSISTTH